MKEISAFLIIFTIIASGFITYQSKFSSLTYVVSTVDKRKYLVRNEPNKQKAADKLANINLQILDFIEKLTDKYRNNDNFEDIVRIKNRYNPDNMSENTKYSRHTSYSVNKGEQMVVCLRQKEDDSFVDNNTILFVILHELAHIMTRSIGHTEEFWTNFKFLLKEAEQFKLYKREDYNSKSKRYCGMDITDNPLNDKDI